MLGASNEVEELQAIREYDNSPIVLTIKKLLEQNREGWTGSATELIDASMFYNTPIRDDSRKLGKSIGKYQDLLYRQDNIIYKAISNGSGAKKHSFYYGHNPFEDE